MRFWLDTEFIENGRTIDLVSIGIVSEDGREYYAVSSDCDRTRANQWVKKNVLPQVDWSLARPRSQIRTEIVEFCGFATYDHDSGTKHQHEFWANYGAYDWVILCQLFGSMDDFPEGWPMYCHDIQQLREALGGPVLPEQSSSHHALEDARGTREAWYFLTNQDPGVITRKALDPNSDVWIEEDQEVASFPGNLLLFNPIAEKYFDLRVKARKTLSASKRILTSPRATVGGGVLYQVPVLNYTTESKVCETLYLRGFRVQLGDGIPEAYMKELWNSQFEFRVDGQVVVKKQSLRTLLGVRQVLVGRQDDRSGCLFSAHRSRSGDDTWMGYMLPNGSRLQATLD